jgi:hypothetical protein
VLLELDLSPHADDDADLHACVQTCSCRGQQARTLLEAAASATQHQQPDSTAGRACMHAVSCTGMHAMHSLGLGSAPALHASDLPLHLNVVLRNCSKSVTQKQENNDYS